MGRSKTQGCCLSSLDGNRGRWCNGTRRAAISVYARRCKFEPCLVHQVWSTKTWSAKPEPLAFRLWDLKLVEEVPSVSSRMRVYAFSRAATLSRSRSPKPCRATPSQAQGAPFTRLAARLKTHTRGAAIARQRDAEPKKVTETQSRKPKGAGRIQQGKEIGGRKNKSSEVVQSPFVSASSSRLTLA
jgi:hypothetical protein